MKINGNAIRPGFIINYNNRLWLAVKIQHTQPGKGGAYLQVELKDIKNGTKLNERFRSSETVEKAHIEETPYQYLYTEGDFITLMNTENYEQISLPTSLLGDTLPFLQESMTVSVSSYEGDIVGVTLPEKVIMEIVEADAVVKGQTASASYKPALLENGVRVMVPPYIEAGTKIVVSTSDATYVERA